MNRIALALILAACGSTPPPSSTPSNDGEATPPPDTRTELERRRDAACDSLGPRLTACAVADAKAELDAGRLTQAQYNEITNEGVQRQNTVELGKSCKVELSSRQVRVLEVCQHEESECAPLIACLENLNTPP